MTARLAETWARLSRFFLGQPPARRMVVAAVGIGSLAAVLSLAWWLQRPLDRPRPPDARVHAHPALPEGSLLGMQTSIERQLVERVESMLAAVVGRDKAIARVAATLDLAHVERTEETYDPERTALRTQRTIRDVDEEGPRTERRDENQRYEVSKVISHTVAPAGVVKQLSVAVLIDGTYAGSGATRRFTPRPQEELDRLRELVKNAVGFSEARGDRIEIASVPLQKPAGPGVLAAPGAWVPALLLRLLAVGLVAAGLFYVVRPLVLASAALPEAPVTPLPPENLALARQDPERTAQLVREWLREGAPAIEG